MKLERHRITSIFLFLTVIVFSGAFTEQILLGVDGAKPSTFSQFLNSGLYIPIYMAFTYYFVKESAALINKVVISHFRILGIFALLSFISIFWAHSALKTFFDSVQFLGTLLVAIGIVMVIPFSLFLRVICYAMFFILSASVIYIFLFPNYGLMGGNDMYTQLAGLPQGVFMHKNTLADVSAIGLFVAFCSHKKIPIYMQLTLILLCIYCLVISGSAGKLVACIMSFFMLFLFRKLIGDVKLKPLLIVILLAFPFLVIVLAPIGLTPTLEMIGKDPTLSGRIFIWEHAIALINVQPIFGYGAGSIWSSSLGYIPIFGTYQPPHSHNFFIEIVLSLGALGLVLVLVFIGQSIKTIFKSNFYLFEVLPLFILMFTALIARSMFEFSLFRGNQISFLMLIVLYGYLIKEQVQLRSRFTDKI